MAHLWKSGMLSGVKITVRMICSGFKTDVENQVYQKTINIADFKSVGTYQVHAYLKNSDGTMLFLGKTAFSIAAPSCDEVISSADKDTGDFQIVVQNAKATGGITYVQIPVWSASDQSDLVWYTAEYNNGNYIVNSNISRHKNNMGIYQYGIYVTMEMVSGQEWHPESGSFVGGGKFICGGEYFRWFVLPD